MKCWKIVKNTHYDFAEPRVMTSFASQQSISKDVPFTIQNDKDEQQKVTFKKLKPANVWRFCVKMTETFKQLIFSALTYCTYRNLCFSQTPFSPLGLRTLMKSAPESIQASLHSFFEAAAADLEMTVENLSVTLVCLPQSRSQQARGVAKVLSYTTSILLPTLTFLFQHVGMQNYGVDLLGKGYLNKNTEIQLKTINVSCHYSKVKAIATCYH